MSNQKQDSPQLLTINGVQYQRSLEGRGLVLTPVNPPEPGAKYHFSSIVFTDTNNSLPDLEPIVASAGSWVNVFGEAVGKLFDTWAEIGKGCSQPDVKAGVETTESGVNINISVNC